MYRDFESGEWHRLKLPKVVFARPFVDLITERVTEDARAADPGDNRGDGILGRFGRG